MTALSCLGKIVFWVEFLFMFFWNFSWERIFQLTDHIFGKAFTKAKLVSAEMFQMGHIRERTNKKRHGQQVCFW